MAMHLPSNKSRGRRTPMAEINVTPMVDIMLVLLIIFMVTAQMMNAGVPVNLPDSRAKALEQDQDPVTVSVDQRGHVYVDDREVSDAALPGALKTIAGRRGPDGQAPQIAFRGDKGIDWEKGMRVLGEINRAGLTRVALVTNASSK